MLSSLKRAGGAIVAFGHGTASEERIAALLCGAHVRLLIDVRTAPGSRRNPHVARAEMQRWLPEHGVDYRWDKRLGGWRKASPDAPDLALRNQSFAGYAEHMRTPEFRAAIAEMLTEATAQQVAIMCAETVPWRCHRWMISDFLTLARNVPVLHLMHDGRLSQHEPSVMARLRSDGLLVYDAGQRG